VGGDGPSRLLRLPLIGEHEVVKMMAVVGGIVLAGCVVGVPVARALLAEGAWLERRLERGAAAAVHPARRAAWGFREGLRQRRELPAGRSRGAPGSGASRS
jgi:hypothetical protein